MGCCRRRQVRIHFFFVETVNGSGRVLHFQNIDNDQMIATANDVEKFVAERSAVNDMNVIRGAVTL